MLPPWKEIVGVKPAPFSPIHQENSVRSQRCRRSRGGGGGRGAARGTFVLIVKLILPVRKGRFDGGSPAGVCRSALRPAGVCRAPCRPAGVRGSPYRWTGSLRAHRSTQRPAGVRRGPLGAHSIFSSSTVLRRELWGSVGVHADCGSQYSCVVFYSSPRDLQGSAGASGHPQRPRGAPGNPQNPTGIHGSP